MIARRFGPSHADAEMRVDSANSPWRETGSIRRGCDRHTHRGDDQRDDAAGDHLSGRSADRDGAGAASPARSEPGEKDFGMLP